MSETKTKKATKASRKKKTARLIGSGVDAIELALPMNRITVRMRNKLHVVSYSYSTQERESPLISFAPLFYSVERVSDENNNVLIKQTSVPGKSAYIDKREIGFRFRIEWQNRSAIAIIDQISIPGFLHGGANTPPACLHDVEEAKRQMEGKLFSCGVECDLSDAEIRRLEIAHDVNTPYMIHNYLPRFESLDLHDERFKLTRYNTAVTYSKGSRAHKEEVCIYDKAVQMKEVKHVSLDVKDGTLIRFEHRAWAGKVAAVFGVTTFAELMTNFDDVVCRQLQFFVDLMSLSKGRK